MTDASDRAEYEQYLKETGQAPAAKKPFSLQRANEELYGPGGLTNEKVGAAAGNALGIMAPSSGLAELIGAKFPKLATAVGMAAPVVEDGTVAAAQSPGNRGEAFLKGAGTSVAMRGASAALNKTGDYLAQKAAGIKDTKVGRGIELMKQHVFGTKGMQEAQVGRKIGEQSEGLASVVNSIKDPVSAANAVGALQEAAEKLKINGKVPSNQTALYKQYTDLAESLKSMTQGESMAIGAPEYQRFKQSQGEVAYNANGKMPDTNVAAAAGLANREAANDIAGAWKSENPPGMPPPPGSYSTGPKPPVKQAPTNAYRGKNAELSALFGAKRGLESKTSLSDLAAIAAMGTAGYVVDGPKGALLGALLKAPVTKSVGAYTARGLGKAAGALASPVARTLTATPADPDRAEYEQYLKETGQSP